MKHFKLPDLGEGLQEAEIVEWHVKAGDSVRADQRLVSVETAKALVDIPRPTMGWWASCSAPRATSSTLANRWWASRARRRTPVPWWAPGGRR